MNKEFNFLVYNTPNQDVKINAMVRDDTIWLTQKSMAELFGVQIPAISKHLKNIFEEGELDENSVVRNFRTTAKDGKHYNVKYYNLEMIIAIGYRVRSNIGTNFRKWATNTLNECLWTN